MRPILLGVVCSVLACVYCLIHDQQIRYFRKERDRHLFHEVGETLNMVSGTENSSNARRFIFSPSPIEPEFAEDLKVLKRQLRENYGSSSNCKRVSLEGIMMWCYGIGTTMNRLNHIILESTLKGEVLQDLDLFTCKWLKEDNTKNCATLFGDCYFPALHWNDTNNDSRASSSTECHDINWFKVKYGDAGLHAGHLSWVLSADDDTAAQQSGGADYEPENCIALHIRRGDTCVNPTRTCFPFEQYFRPTQHFVQAYYPELNRIVVLTDDAAFPKKRFEELVPNGVVEYNEMVDRTKYNVDHLANGTILDWMPEYRPLNNTASELFSEVAAASRCKVLVGTLTSGISKWVFLSMMARQGRLPMFYSLEGCMSTAFSWKVSAEDSQCEKPLFTEI